MVPLFQPRAGIPALIARTDGYRGPGLLGGEALHKEWFHFCALAPDVEVIVNFSVCETGASPGAEVGRVIVLVAERDRARGPARSWHGGLDSAVGRDLDARFGRIEIRVGTSALRYDDGAFGIEVALEDRPIALSLSLRPTTLPLVRPHTRLDGGEVHWLVVPRLVTSGTVTVDGRTHVLDGAPAYHDHNWGRFSWGRDFGWQWGFGLPSERDPQRVPLTPRDEPRGAVGAHAPASETPERSELQRPGAGSAAPWSVVFVRLVDRARTRDLVQGMFLWKGALQHRIFREGDIEAREEGFLRPARVTKLPSVMGLLAPELPTDVPRVVELLARDGRDHLACRLEAEDLAQIILPDETGLGLTVINEVSARLTLAGEVRGERVAAEGRAMFELLTATA